jgi:hypothetical protein
MKTLKNFGRVVITICSLPIMLAFIPVGFVVTLCKCGFSTGEDLVREYFDTSKPERR